ncbi:hypothetical protein H7U19_08420 [Hyunsoonleella sp. SJ7]|uniref:MG2 domain-containing protein n=1 Tax=Hyunsoonleella aquatilis TaxID=2762758 RepID=A0A923KIE8_9FLAO|nr:hypothetical protein [Hyunsoonleella aquatilis]MBC3758424.1 hypothetical protein [Hyunsoonleella aquatilis]
MIFIFCFLGSIYSQTKNPLHLKKTTKNTFAEKIYLQLNNSVFTNNETIWFKAIVTDAKNAPTNLSGILHVELIDFDKDIVATKKLKLVNGMADNGFKLEQAYTPGRYLIRAYTAWNKNFGEDFMFKQYVNLVPANGNQRPSPIQNITLYQVEEDQHEVFAQLFPELIKPDYKKDVTVYIKTETFLDTIEIKRENGFYKLQYVLPKDAVSVNLKMKLEDTKLKNFQTRVEKTYNKTIAIDREFIDLQFFPESGKLINGLTSKLAFKALNYKGLGKEINGVIVDEKDSIVVPIKTNNLGMGYVFFTPKLHKTYYGKINSKHHVARKFELPKVYAEGHVLGITETTSYMNINVTSKVKATRDYWIQLKSKGVLLKEFPVTLSNAPYNASIPKQKLPQGILNVTLLSEHKTPLSERLFFHLNEADNLNITKETEGQYYSQRDKTALKFKVANSNGRPVEANLSVLVVDKNQIEQTEQFKGNILSYFLLNSELKGHIENPTHYFDDDNIFRKRDLEALMLTQGWRNYKYSFNDANHVFDIQPETALRVSGKVRSIWNENKAPKNRVNLNVLTSGKPPGFYSCKPDSIGNFAFDLIHSYGDKLELKIQSSNKKGKPKFYEIILDEPVPSPKITYEKEEVIALPDSVINDFLEIKKQERQAVTGFDLDDSTVALDAVELTGYNVTPERERIFKLHGPPDIVIDNEQLKEREEKWMSGLYDLLRVKFPDDVFIKAVKMCGGGFFYKAQVYGTDDTLVFIDGEVVLGRDYLFLPNLSIENIKSVEILERPSGTFMNHIMEAFPRMDPMARSIMVGTYNFGIVSIYTFGGIGLRALEVSKGLFQGHIAGFSITPEFYQPKYETLKPEDWYTPDLRPVLHWEPSLFTDKKGNIELEFYNDDIIGDKLIIIEAIAPNGKIGYFETSYTVEKHKENN